MSLISYSTTRDLPGLGGGTGFIQAEGEYLEPEYGAALKHLFNWMGIAILLT